MASFKKLKAEYLSAAKSRFGGFKGTKHGYMKLTSLPCKLKEGDYLGDLIISEIRVSRKERQALIIAKEK